MTTHTSTPASRIARAHARTAEASGDEPTRASLVSSAEMQTRILAILEDGPLHKWELRDRLGFNEARVYQELLALRDAGRVKVIGKQLDRRKWALRGYIVATPRVGKAARPAEPTPTERPLESWWVTAQTGDRSAFYKAADARNRKLLSSYEWRQTGTLRFKP